MGDRDAKRQRGARRARAGAAPDDLDDLLGAAGMEAREKTREDDDDRGRAIDGDGDDDDDASDGTARGASDDASGSDSRAKATRGEDEGGEARRDDDDEGGRDPGRDDDDDDEEEEDVMDAECGEEEEGSDGDAREEEQGNKANARKRGRKPRAANEEGARGDADAEASLPRRTEVTITGNARTKTELIGMKGVVKKSLPSGGWHRVVLENGREVRVRRSALTASETGRGDEEGERGEEGDDDEDEDDEDDDDDDDKDNMATRARRPTRVPGNGPPSQAAAAAMKRLQERRRSARPNCQSNFERLTLSTLQKYKKVYEMEANPETDGDKNALVHEVGKHFMQQKLDEQKVLQAFMCAVADTTQIG